MRRRDAISRFAANRAATAGACLVAALTACGLLAPVASSCLTGFSYDEQHTWLALMPAGTRDVSLDRPSYDGDTASFDAVDLDHDGGIACSRAASIIHCPEIEALSLDFRFYQFIFTDHDVAPRDGVISRTEFLSAAATRDGTATAPRDETAFASMDADSDGFLTRDEVASGTRAMRLDARDLIRHDEDGDLSISADEFPGLPRLRTFILGTDEQGRDRLTRLLYGLRISILVALLSAAVSLVIGVAWGATAAYTGGRTDALMMRFVDVLYGLPFMFLVIVIIAVAGRSVVNLFVALGCVQWLTMARVVRGQVISLRQREFVEAAVLGGAGRFSVIVRHLIPNALGPVVVYATLMIPAIIMEEAFLSFLGLGVQPPLPSLGNLVAEAAALLETRPAALAWPAGLLALLSLAMNFAGDGLRDALDPKQAGRP